MSLLRNKLLLQRNQFDGWMSHRFPETVLAIYTGRYPIVLALLYPLVLKLLAVRCGADSL